MSPATTTRVVEFLGLADLAHVAGREASFPLGVLYPYSSDLQRVCTRYDALCQASPDAASFLFGQITGPRAPLAASQAGAATAFLASLATLHSRIAFAPDWQAHRWAPRTAWPATHWCLRHVADAGRAFVLYCPMVRWEYLIVALPEFRPPTSAPGGSAAVTALNREGEVGWEAVGMTALGDGVVAVLLKRPIEE